jgi:TetR/AcrR family transcriptional regulator, transcriptional repressor for nem operon
MKDTREQILSVAYDLFLQKGYKSVSIKKITDSVGMTKGSFYYFFENKEQLFMEIFDRFFVAGMRTDFSLFSHESLYCFYHDYYKLMTNQKSENEVNSGKFSINFYAYIFDSLKHFPELLTRAKESFVEERKSWVKIIKIARENGEIESPMSNEQIADIFIFTNDGLGMQGVFESNRTGLKKRLISLWDAFYEGIKV